MATVSTGQFFIIDVNDGSSLYTASIYQQAVTQPNTPTGGTYNYASLTLTAPTTWSSTLPSATTTPTWVSYYTFSTTDRTATITAATWSVPTIYSQKGDPGVTAKTLSVISDRQNITYDSSGNINPSVQTTTFTAQKQNTTATVTWTMTKADGTALTASTYLSATTGDTVTMTAEKFNTARETTQGVIVTGSITDGSTITDSISVVKSADGAAAIVGVLTNEATTLAADSTGTVSNFTPASGNFNVYSGTSDVTSSATFTVYSQTGCTVAITTAGAYSVSAMSSDSASAVLQADYNSVTIRKTLSLAKSKAGINAITLLLTADRQTIVYDSSGNPSPATQTTTFTAQKQNTTATVNWTMTKLDGTTLTPSTYLSAVTGDSVTMTETNFAAARGTTNGVIVKASLTDGSVSVNDTVTIVKISPIAGSTGERGSKSFYATTTATSWAAAQDAEANTAVTSAGYTNVVGDEVTLYNNGATKWTMTKRWDGSTWANIGTVIDGSLIVSGSVTSSAIDTRNLSIKDGSGNVLFSSGVNLDFSLVGGTTKPADNANKTFIDTNGAIQGVSSGAGTTIQNSLLETLTFGTTNVTASGNTFKKTGGSNGTWDAQAYSKESYALGAYCSFSPDQTNAYIMCGLNTDPQTDASHSSIDYAWYTLGDGSSLHIYESGTSIGYVGTYEAGDILSITYDGSNIRYYQNSTLKRTVAVSITNPLFFDSSIHTSNGSVSKVKFGPMSSNAWSQIGGTGKPADNANNTYVDANGAIQGVSSGAGTAIQNSLLDTLTFGTTNVTASGNTITKTGGSDGTWDAQGYSKESYTLGAYCSFSSAVNNTAVAAGLNTDPLTNAGYNSIDFAFLLSNNGSLFIYELNAFVLANDTYAAGDIFSITYDGSKVRYYQNGVVKRTTTVTITDPLYFDSSIMTMNASISKIKFGPMTSNAWSQIGGTNKPADNATKNNVYQQGSAPTSGMGVNDIWYKTGVSPAELYTYSGTAWVLSSTVGATSSQISDITTATNTANSASSTATTANNTANAASTAAADRLSKSAVNAINSGCALTIGSISVAADGSRSSGTGIIISNYGILGYNSSGVNTFNISSGGDSQFKGSLLIGSSPAVSGNTMTGTGGIINPSDGSFAFGNASNNISFNGTTLTVNGNIVATGNIKSNAVDTTKIAQNNLTKTINSYVASGNAIASSTTVYSPICTGISYPMSHRNANDYVNFFCNSSFDTSTISVRRLGIVVSGNIYLWNSAFYAQVSYNASYTGCYFTTYTSTADSNSRYAVIYFSFKAKIVAAGFDIYTHQGSDYVIVQNSTLTMTTYITQAAGASRTPSEINMGVTDIYA